MIFQRLHEVKILQAQTSLQLEGHFKQIESKFEEQSTVLSSVVRKVETVATATYEFLISY
jgi:hypothetical protein